MAIYERWETDFAGMTALKSFVFLIVRPCFCSDNAFRTCIYTKDKYHLVATQAFQMLFQLN